MWGRKYRNFSNGREATDPGMHIVTQLREQVTENTRLVKKEICTLAIEGSPREPALEVFSGFPVLYIFDRFNSLNTELYSKNDQTSRCSATCSTVKSSKHIERAFKTTAKAERSVEYVCLPNRRCWVAGNCRLDTVGMRTQIAGEGT